MTSPATEAVSGLPSALRRVAIYLFFDPSGIVDDYILHKLSALRDHCEHILVVSNSPIEEASRQRLATAADEIFERENVGFDVWAYKEALAELGEERLAQYDELLLMNYTFFGPVGSFSPLFERMDALPGVDFWGITDHDVAVHPYAPDIPLPRHIQSHWLAVRRAMFTSEAWRAYWRDMPMITSYIDSIVQHEARFTRYFTNAGFKGETAFPLDDYPTAHPIAESTEAILADGCPIVKRRSFFSDPFYLDRRGIDTRQIAQAVALSGYPMDLLYSNLARTSEPRVLAANLGLLEVLPDRELSPVPSSLRVAGIGHAPDAAGVERLVSAFGALPAGSQIVITVPEGSAAASAPVPTGVEIRPVPAHVGTSTALLVGARDLIEGDAIDVLVRLHADRGPGLVPITTSAQREHQLFRDVIASPGHLRNTLELFERWPSLGMTIPPVVHMGFGTLGRGWAKTRPRAERLAKRAAIAVPFDENTPLAPHGGMFVARPAALRPLLAAAADWPAPLEGEVRPGGPRDLEGALERLLAYSALSQGLHVRQVTHPDTIALGYPLLEVKLAHHVAERHAAALKRKKKRDWLGRRRS